MLKHRLAWLTGFLPALLLVVGLVSTGSVWVWQTGIRDQVEELRSERFRFSLLHLKSALESGLRLGNTVADLATTDALIAQVRDHQPDILSIDVFDAQGDVVFSTDPGGLGLKLPTAWVPTCLRSDDKAFWRGQDADGGVQCVGLVNAFGQAAGGVLLRHRWSARASDGLALPTDWPWLTVTVLALTVLSAWLATVVVAPLDAAATRLHNHLTGGTLPATGAEEAEALGLGPATAALQAMHTQSRWLAEADAEADQLDRQEAA